MNNKLFVLLILLLVLPFFGWLYYDWKSDSENIKKESAQHNLLVDPGTGESAGVQFIFHFPDPAYSHNLTTAQIEELAHDQPGSEHFHVYGLTQAGYSTSTLYKVNWSKKWFKDEYKMWVEDLRVEFTYDTLNVYVSNAYPEGGCEYQATMDHEKQHVEVHRRIYQEYQKILRDTVGESKAIPLPSSPIQVDSILEGKKKIGETISSVIDPVFDQFKDALQAEQGKLDTPDNYSALKQQCQHW